MLEMVCRGQKQKQRDQWGGRSSNLDAASPTRVVEMGRSGWIWVIEGKLS